MSTRGLARLGSGTLVLGGLCLAIGWTIDVRSDSVPGRALVVASNILLVFGLTALYGLVLAPKGRAMALLGWVAACLGHVTMSTVTFLTMVGAGPNPVAYELLQAPPGLPFAATSGVLLLLGYLATGWAARRSEELPGWPGVMLMLGIVPLFIGAGPLGVRPLATVGALLVAAGLVGVARRVAASGAVS